MNAMLQEGQPEPARDAVQRIFRAELRNGYTVAGCHRYNDDDGNELFRVVRLRHPQHEKIILPMHRVRLRYQKGRGTRPAAGWPLYRPPYPLVETDPVLIVEGEACADELAKRGISAVTSGSADSANLADWTPLRGRSARLWPDNDEAGAKYGKAASARLSAQGVPVDVLDVDRLDLPLKGDCVDWLAKNPQATREDIEALPIIPQAATAASNTTPAANLPRLRLVDAASLKSVAVRWLWPGWLARGKLHVLAGAPGTGKTTVAMHWTACVTAGRPFPSGWRPTPGRVLIWSGEDDPTDTLLPRLEAAGADVSRVQFVGDVDDNGQRYPFDPARDVPLLVDALADVPDLAMIVVDPLVSAVAGDSHKNAEVRRALAPLVELAQRRDAALLGITHYSKGTQGREPLERVSGSLAFGAMARIVYGTVRMKSDDDSERRMLLARCKSNIGPDGGGFAYTFEHAMIGDGIEASRIAWGEAVEGSARELLGEAKPEDDDGHDDAAGFLRDLLAGGSRPANEVYREAEGAGYSRPQMKRAKVKIGAEAVKLGMSDGWAWRLPKREGNAEGNEGTEQNSPYPSHPSGADPSPSGDFETVDL